MRGELARPYNVGSEECATIAEIAQSVSKIATPNVNVEICGIPNPAFPVEKYVPSAKRAHEELGIYDNFVLNEKIQRAIDWFRSH